MSSVSIKRLILVLLGTSFYMLFTLLLVTAKPADWAVFLLMLFFAFLLVGLEYFFTIGTVQKPAPVTHREFFLFAVFIPFWVFMFASAFSEKLRRELALTALALFVASVYRIVLGTVDKLKNSKR